MHGATKYITRHGKRIEVVELNPGIALRKVRKADGAFAVIPLKNAALAAKAMKAPALLVYVDMMYRAWKAKGRPFNMPNGWLKRYGVDRKIKSRTLRNLEKGGLISIDRRNRKTPRITLVGP